VTGRHRAQPDARTAGPILAERVRSEVLVGLRAAQEPLEIRGWNRAADQIALEIIATALAEEIGLLVGLDTLGHDLEIETVSEYDDGLDETRLRNEELQVLATCDPLTGLSNWRSFMMTAELEFETAKRDERELICVMVDIDHFKRVNDQHGHSMGDEVICRLAQELVSKWQDRDKVCRFGGEEFCMLLSNAELGEGVRLVDQLRRSIAAVGFAPVPVTASFGISSITFGAARFYDLLDQADQALYASKENGRNRVTCYDAIDRAS
jgi:diguanylate cyclase (GGDEF)-like protein